MSLKGMEDKAAEPSIPETYTRQYADFCRTVERETDADALGQAQVRFHQLLMRLSTLKIAVPLSWSDACNKASAKMGELRRIEFQRRMS